MNRLDFIACPLCSGHEKIGSEAALVLSDAIELHLALGGFPPHVVTELMNINNAILNAQEPGRAAPAQTEESWLDA